MGLKKMKKMDKVKALRAAKAGIKELQDKQQSIFNLVAPLVGVDPSKINNKSDVLWDALFNDFGKIDRHLIDKLK